MKSSLHSGPVEQWPVRNNFASNTCSTFIHSVHKLIWLSTASSAFVESSTHPWCTAALFHYRDSFDATFLHKIIHGKKWAFALPFPHQSVRAATKITNMVHSKIIINAKRGQTLYGQSICIRNGFFSLVLYEPAVIGATNRKHAMQTWNDKKKTIIRIYALALF